MWPSFARVERVGWFVTWSEISARNNNNYKIGVVPQDLPGRKPGRLNHGWWLTLDNSVCCLYVSSEKPSNLPITTHFIVTNFGPNWFDINKINSICTGGARYIYVAAQRFKLLSSDMCIWGLLPLSSRRPTVAKVGCWNQEAERILVLFEPESILEM